MTVRRPMPEQEYGTEFAGVVRDNTLPPKPTVEDLTAAEKRTLIVTTGQATDPTATARQRNFYGQKGPQPADPPPPRYPR